MQSRENIHRDKDRYKVWYDRYHSSAALISLYMMCQIGQDMRKYLLSTLTLTKPEIRVSDRCQCVRVLCGD